jgi:DNA/RNA endonuclease G (NUC1)
MKPASILFILPFFSTFSFGQVELPNTTSGCSVMHKNKFWYCINEKTYQPVWTAIKIEKSDIENHQFFPPDKDFFPGMSKINGKVWDKLENQVKYWAMEFDSVFVVTGNAMYYDNSINDFKFGYFKAILKGCKGDAIAFLVCTDQDSEDLLSYAVSVDFIESKTDFDFFPTLSTDLQKIIESSFNADFWPISIQ